MKNYKKFCLAAMFSALVLLGTTVIQVPSINGYVHIGDAFVYLTACFLPAPYSLIAAGLGAAIADMISPYFIYTLPTFAIKMGMAAMFSSKGGKVLTKRNFAAVFLAALINVLGYYITEATLFPQGSLAATLTVSANTIPGNLVQSLTAGVIFVIAAFTLDKLKFKSIVEKI